MDVFVAVPAMAAAVTAAIPAVVVAVSAIAAAVTAASVGSAASRTKGCCAQVCTGLSHVLEVAGMVYRFLKRSRPHGIDQATQPWQQPLDEAGQLG